MTKNRLALVAEQKGRENVVEHGMKLSNMSNFSTRERHLQRTRSPLQNDRLDDDPILMRQPANSQHQQHELSEH